jgi:competence protein ComGC
VLTRFRLGEKELTMRRKRNGVCIVMLIIIIVIAILIILGVIGPCNQS